jgi:hypothetical protein
MAKELSPSEKTDEAKAIKVKLEYDDAKAFWDLADGPTLPDAKGMGVGESRAKGNEAWNGTKDYPSAAQLARYGWPEGAKFVEETTLRLSEAVGRRIPVDLIIQDIAGSFVNVPAYIAGEPADMLRVEPAITSGKRIAKVVYNCSASCGVSSEVLMRRGAVACALVDVLGRAGFLAELVVCEWIASYHNTKLGVELMVKRSDEPLNFDRAAFCLAHPSMLRRMMFAIEENCLDKKTREEFGIQRGGGYGTPCHIPVAHRGDINFDRMHGAEPEWNDIKTAEDAAMKMLVNSGIIQID